MKTSRASAIVAGLGASAAVVLALGAQFPTSWTAQSTSTEPNSTSETPGSAGSPTQLSGTSAVSGEVSTPATEAANPTTLATPAPAVPPVAVTNGDRSVPKVALTFDADLSQYTINRIYNGTMPEQYNVAVVDYLESTGTPATMFVTGLWVQRYPLAMERFAANNLFEIANHTYSHDAWTSNCYKLPYITDVGNKQDQVRYTSSAIAAFTGEQPRYFRFPGLCHTPADVALVASMGLAPVDTDIQGSDAFAKNPAAIAQSIAAQAQAGSVILLHLNGAPNAAATLQVVQQLLPLLHERGLQPVTLSELLAS